MADVIKLLPDAIANQIAAGEVIQRPASAVKEMLENAIDAGSTRITLIVKNGGKALIQVIDNGSGMSETDARLCFERHATSKITQAKDLFAIRTMGFRGEALASLAAIAKVEVKTRQKEEEVGVRIVIEGSEVVLQEPCQCAAGTSIAVKNLFYNVPARRNFLKRNAIEMRHIIDEFQRVALANAKIHFELYNNDVQLFHLAAANLRKRIVNILGKNFNARLVPVEEEADFFHIYGFIGKPEFARKTRGEQYFFVNERFIKSGYLHHAVVSAYDELLQPKSYPLYILFIDIDPARIDVNVHPTKQEIKFDDEKVVYTFMNAAVKRALGVYNVTPSIDFDQNVNLSFIQPVSQKKSQQHNSSASNSTNQTSHKEQKDVSLKNSNLNLTRHKQAVPINWQELYKIEDLKTDADAETTTITIQSDFGKQTTLDVGDEKVSHQDSFPCQLHRTYILSQIKSGFIMVRQQAAHERILYEKYLLAIENNPASTQKQLFPQTIELPVADAELLKEILPEINALGYDIQEFGKGTFVVHGTPSDVKAGNEQKVIEYLIEQYKFNATNLKLPKRANVAQTMARNNAIKSGQKMEVAEMKNLLDQLFACQKPFVAPNGKPTFVTYRLRDIEKQFEA